jgi:hypothetical protein
LSRAKSGEFALVFGRREGVFDRPTDRSAGRRGTPHLPESFYCRPAPVPPFAGTTVTVTLDGYCVEWCTTFRATTGWFSS